MVKTRNPQKTNAYGTINGYLSCRVSFLVFRSAAKVSR